MVWFKHKQTFGNRDHELPCKLQQREVFPAQQDGNCQHTHKKSEE